MQIGNIFIHSFIKDRRLRILPYHIHQTKPSTCYKSPVTGRFISIRKGFVTRNQQQFRRFLEFQWFHHIIKMYIVVFFAISNDYYLFCSPSVTRSLKYWLHIHFKSCPLSNNIYVIDFPRKRKPEVRAMSQDIINCI